MPTTTSPFQSTVKTPLIAVMGERNGYIQLASAHLNTHYADMPSELLLAARQWAAQLQTMGAKRVYWITLSEVVTHLHIHLYPRWDDTEVAGIELFSQRDSEAQPAWTDTVKTALNEWATMHHVKTVDSILPTAPDVKPSGMGNPFTRH